ncbi:hypothetical protein FH972_023690 [Carpinus fangiana]|uniref:Uncharacterized protein n=1 Tax=Carpinus fangiana TaxID=176857 RepID=A0A5N6KWA6_9ROSI|nr:hypothetical protein FH972_023690 [Carpinus fangiana]
MTRQSLGRQRGMELATSEAPRLAVTKQRTKVRPWAHSITEVGSVEARRARGQRRRRMVEVVDKREAEQLTREVGRMGMASIWGDAAITTPRRPITSGLSPLRRLSTEDMALPLSLPCAPALLRITTPSPSRPLPA